MVTAIRATNMAAGRSLSLAVWTILLGTCLSVCPDGSIVHGGSCYVFFHMRTTWSEAAFYCRLLNTQLVSMDTSAEQKFIANYLTREGSAAFLSDGAMWTGGTTMLTDGRWVWEARAQSVTYANWAPGEPATDSNQKRCLTIDTTTFQWHAASCERKHGFVCESAPVDTGIVVG